MEVKSIEERLQCFDTTIMMLMTLEWQGLKVKLKS